MRCDEFESRLNEALDARRNPADDRLLARHAGACGRCRQLAAAMDLIGESLRWSERPEPSEALARNVLAQVASTRPAAQRSWSVWSHLTLAAAIALLVMVVVPRRSAEPDRPAVARAVAPISVEAMARAEVPEPALAPVGQLAREATSRYATLAQNTSDSLSGVWSMWRPLTLPQQDEETAGAPAREPLLAEMAAGLRPLADSTAGAMSFLLDILPQGQSAPAATPAPAPEGAAGQAAT